MRRPGSFFSEKKIIFRAGACIVFFRSNFQCVPTVPMRSNGFLREKTRNIVFKSSFLLILDSLELLELFFAFQPEI